MEASLEQLQFQNGDVRLNAVAAGPQDGPALLLLHGFPEFWYSWRKQIEPLAAAGFRVVVPDQRGYNKSSKPAGAKSYALSLLTSDIIAIVDQLRRDRIFLAGHDWGAAVAWATALQYPNRIARLAILNVPHPSVMRRYLSTNRRQLRRSWYMFFFQLPWLPEFSFSRSNFRTGASTLVRSSRPGTFSPEDLAQYKDAWSQPGALTAMMNWYRAAFRFRTRFADSKVRVPTRILWGMRDAFLMSEMAQDSLRYCTEGELFTLADASHWLQHEQPERVTELLLDFFRR
jgi:epoxide hydrolase 4